MLGMDDGSGNVKGPASGGRGDLGMSPESHRKANTLDEREQIFATLLFAIVVLVIIIAGLEWVRLNGFPFYDRSIWFGYTIGIIVIGFLGGGIYYFREYRRPRPLLYPAVEIAVGVATATQAFRYNPNLPGIMYLVFLLAGLRTVVDGLKRFKDFWDERAKEQSKRAQDAAHASEAS